MTRGEASMGPGAGRGIVHGTVEFRCLGTAVVAELIADQWQVLDLPEGAIGLRITVQSSPVRIDGVPMRPGAARSLHASAVIGDDLGPSGRPARRMDTRESARTTKPYGREADAITLDVVGRIVSK